MATEADKLTSTDKLSADALASEAGVVARFKSPGESVFSVSPTASSGFNTLRRPLRPSACWRIDDLRFDFDSSFIKPDAAKEFALLALLVQRTGEVMSRTEIASLVWDIHFDSETNVIDVAIRRLRAKVDDPFDIKLIHTVRGVGYVLEQRTDA